MHPNMEKVITLRNNKDILMLVGAMYELIKCTSFAVFSKNGHGSFPDTPAISSGKDIRTAYKRIDVDICQS